jgi:hypothetical protein
MSRVPVARWLPPLLVLLVACGASNVSIPPPDASPDPSLDAGSAVDAAPPDAAGDANAEAATVDAGTLTPCPVSGPRSFTLPSTSCFTVTPADAGASAAGENASEPSYAIAPDSGANGKLMLWLNGSGGHPGGKEALPDPTKNVLAAAASLGYAVLAVSYASTTSVGSLCKQTAGCFLPTRKSIILGAAQPNAATGVSTIKTDEGIVDRVVRALGYLAARDPAHGWGAFLSSVDTTLPADQRIRWSAVTAAGHSQGGGHAAAIGKLFAVARVLQFSATCDNVGGVPAGWTAAGTGTWATDPTMFYGLGAPTTFTNGVATDGDLTCASHLASWQNEGMIPSHQNDAAATCGQTGDTHGASAGCTDNYPAWLAMLK